MTALDHALARLLALGGARPERRYFASGARLHVLLQGSGHPLLLLHGGGGGAGNWYRLLAPLANHARVIAPDLPGFAHSDDVPLEPPLGLQAARLLVRLLDALAIERADVLGTSFGGLAALQLARHFPGRVRRLVLLDSAGLAQAAPALLWWGTRPLVAPWALRPSPGGTRWLLRRLLTSARLERPHEDALVAYLLASAGAHQRAVIPALRAFLSGRAQSEWLRPAELAEIAAPVLLLWGGRDRFFPPAQAHAAAAALPDARVRIIPEAGHSPNWERPADVLGALHEFLFEKSTSVGGGGVADAEEDP